MRQSLICIFFLVSIFLISSFSLSLAQKNLKLSKPYLFKAVGNDTSLFTVDVPSVYDGISLSVYCENQCKQSFFFNVSKTSDPSIHWTHQDSSGVPTFLITSKNSPPFSSGKYTLGVKTAITSKVSLIVVGYQAGQNSFQDKPLVHLRPKSGRHTVVFKTPNFGSDILSYKMFTDKKQNIQHQHYWGSEKLVAQGMLSTSKTYSEIDVDPSISKQRDKFVFFIRVKDHVSNKVTELHSTEAILFN